MNNNLFTYCLRLGDNALILGHRLSELCSRGPFIEEDLALTNLSLDMIGRAQALLKYAADVENKNRTEDDLAYRRAEINYYNHLITEQPNGDFAHTIARQLFISAFEFYQYSELVNSRNQTLAGIAGKTIKEISYHLLHASDWTIRLGDGTKESKSRMQNAINNLWMYTGELFEMDEVDMALLQEGIAADLVTVKVQWHNHIKQVLNEAGLEVPEDAYMQSGSRNGVHSEHLGHILAEMQYLQRAYPDATW